MLLAMFFIAFALNAGGHQHTFIPRRFCRYLIQLMIILLGYSVARAGLLYRAALILTFKLLERNSRDDAFALRRL
jgi:hypothetical protein